MRIPILISRIGLARGLFCGLLLAVMTDPGNAWWIVGCAITCGLVASTYDLRRGHG
jgi:hypothetical protein